MNEIAKYALMFTSLTAGTSVKEIALMQQKIDRMEEILRRLYFKTQGRQDDIAIPVTDDIAIDHYAKHLISFIKEHTKQH